MARTEDEKAVKDIALRESNRRKKKYLLQYREMLISEKNINNQIDELRNSYALPKSPNYDAMPHAHNTEHDLSDYVAKMDKLLMLLQRAADKRAAIRLDITQRIESMQSETEKNILYFRYIYGYKFADIAERMYYTERYTLQLHGEALEHFPY